MSAVRTDTAPPRPDTGPPPHPRRWTARRRGLLVVLVLTVAFLGSRLIPLALTLDPTLYGPDISNPLGDLARYGGWAAQIVGDGLVPYRDVDIEYPPASLPFVILPAVVGQATFSDTVFIALMAALDLAAFVALLVLARRGGSHLGAFAWIVLPPALGVLLYARLDMIPSVAVLLALVAAHARRWTASGIWIGLGAAAKLFPALFVPLLLLAAAGRRLRLLGGVTVGAVAAWLPFAADTGELVGDVLGYHDARGIHLESLWGSLLNLERIGGGSAELVFEFGAFHITGPGAADMLAWTTRISVATVVVVVAVATVRWWGRPDRARVELPVAVTATLALLLATGRVFSPQFVIWLLAAAAVMLAVTPRLWWWVLPTLAVIVGLTAVGYPIGFDLLRAGERWPALVLVWRNLAVLAFGVLLMLRWQWGFERPRDVATRTPDPRTPRTL